MAASLTFLEAYEKDGDLLLDRLVTGDETWVKHVTCETKKQSMEWGHTTQRFGDDAELQAGVNEWLKSQAANFCDDGINKLVHRYDKCLNLNGDYVEK